MSYSLMSAPIRSASISTRFARHREPAVSVPSVVCPELEIVVNENLGMVTMVYGLVRDLVI